MEDILRRHNVPLSEDYTAVRRWSMACPALPTCGLAVSESERVMPSIMDELEVELEKLGLQNEVFTTRMTGCPNGCARPYNSDIGLVGKTKDKYTIFLGGRVLGDRLNFIYKDLVPTAEVVPTLVPVFRYFKEARQNGESFGEFCHRVGKDDDCDAMRNCVSVQVAERRTILWPRCRGVARPEIRRSVAETDRDSFAFESSTPHLRSRDDGYRLTANNAACSCRSDMQPFQINGFDRQSRSRDCCGVSNDQCVLGAEVVRFSSDHELSHHCLLLARMSPLRVVAFDSGNHRLSSRLVRHDHALLQSVAIIRTGPAVRMVQYRRGPAGCRECAAVPVSVRRLAEEYRHGAAALRCGEKAACRAPRDESTIDNSGTYTQLRFLARAHSATNDERVREAFLKGLDWLLAAQYDSGGWPMFHPPRKGYYTHIDFNDNAQSGVMMLMDDVAKGDKPFDFVDAERRKRAAAAFDKGIDCILKCQVVVDGKRTAWCAQHDEKTFAPAPARTFEPVSFSGHESVGLVRCLMRVDNPSPEIIAAVQGAVTLA